MTMAEPQEASAAPAEPFHIVMDPRPSGGYMWVGICFNDHQALMAELAEKRMDHDASSVQLLFVAVDKVGNEVARSHCSLERNMAHLTFTRAGEFTIHAAVVWPTDARKSTFKRVVDERREDSTYYTSLYNSYDKDLYLELSRHTKNKSYVVARLAHVSKGTVVVSADNFGKEPPAWLETFIKVFFSDKGRVECDLRRRVLLSMLGSVTVLPLHYLIKLILLVAFSVVRAYGIDLGAVVRPVRYGGIAEAFEDCLYIKRSAWFYRKKTEHAGFEARPRWQVWGVVISVISLMISSIVSAAANISWVQALLYVLLPLLGVVALCVIMPLVVNMVTSIRQGTTFRQRAEKREADRMLAQMERYERERERLDRTLQGMSCSVQGKPMTIGQLKERQRTNPVVVMRGVKDAVCRPYQR